ncbi:hypothetical protein QBC47DRAFT_392378 [Echria macrotheca]|uniref:DUF8035 domain-containing protein n=1 Tax=Echria macrotheca TaxID=438768 RepID=A0AAJ0B3T8_9PEZI|nr:hypothetical protein QBC47DRAFT_392378 [Echria macrotheca]
MWTEITKDLVTVEAIHQMGYIYEETDYYFYIMEYLTYVSTFFEDGFFSYPPYFLCIIFNLFTTYLTNEYPPENRTKFTTLSRCRITSGQKVSGASRAESGLSVGSRDDAGTSTNPAPARPAAVITT